MNSATKISYLSALIALATITQTVTTTQPATAATVEERLSKIQEKLAENKVRATSISEQLIDSDLMAFWGDFADSPRFGDFGDVPIYDPGFIDFVDAPGFGDFGDIW